MDSRLQEVREKMLLTLEEAKPFCKTAKMHYATGWTENYVWDALGLLKAQQDKDFNTPILIEGGKCPECLGSGSWVEGDDACNAVGDPCDKCKGTGKLPDKTITVREAIERVMG